MISIGQKEAPAMELALRSDRLCAGGLSEFQTQPNGALADDPGIGTGDPGGCQNIAADPDAGPGSGKQRLKISGLREKGGSAVREEKKKKRGRVPFFSSIQMKYAMSYLAIVSVVLILLNTYPVLASQDLLFGSKRVR